MHKDVPGQPDGTVIKSDQEEARKCYENSLKMKKSVFMVFERPPSVDTTMIEATPARSTPDEATRT